MVTTVLSDHLCCAPKGLSPQNFALFFHGTENFLPPEIFPQTLGPTGPCTMWWGTGWFAWSHLSKIPTLERLFVPFRINEAATA